MYRRIADDLRRRIESGELPPGARIKSEVELMEEYGQGMVKYLETLGIKQAGWRDTIVARPPTGNERAFFGLSDRVQVAIFEFRRTAYDENGIPIRFTVTVYPADRNEFQMEAGRVPSHTQ
jgi:GntR family transcriptional regulator